MNKEITEMLILKDLQEIHRRYKAFKDGLDLFCGVTSALLGVDVYNTPLDVINVSTIKEAIDKNIEYDLDLEEKIIAAIMREYEKKERKREKQ